MLKRGLQEAELQRDQAQEQNMFYKKLLDAGETSEINGYNLHISRVVISHLQMKCQPMTINFDIFFIGTQLPLQSVLGRESQVFFGYNNMENSEKKYDMGVNKTYEKKNSHLIITQ